MPLTLATSRQRRSGSVFKGHHVRLWPSLLAVIGIVNVVEAIGFALDLHGLACSDAEPHQGKCLHYNVA